MLYQKILTDDRPYQLMLNRLYPFGEHRHADIEFHYAVRGSFDIVAEKKPYHVCQGEVFLIGSGASHSSPDCDDSDRVVLTGIVGSSFLKRHFSAFASSPFSAKTITFSENLHDRKELRKVLNETVRLYPDINTDKGSLLISSNIYRICALLLEEINDGLDEPQERSLTVHAAANIEKALDLIYYDYKKELTVEAAASVSGYGKSNFCKIFKRITGVSFHKALNDRRINVAKGLLAETDMTVSAIAEDVGFGQTKTFCRVFHEHENMTPMAYRKQNKR